MIDTRFLIVVALIVLFLEWYLAWYYNKQIRDLHIILQSLVFCVYWSTNTTAIWLLLPSNRWHISFEPKDSAFAIGIGFFATLLVTQLALLKPNIKRS